MVSASRRLLPLLALCAPALVPASAAGQEPVAGVVRGPEPGGPRGWLGVRVEERYDCGWEAAADWKNCELVTRIRELQADGPAARAGLLAGDRVVAIGGREIRVGTLRGALAAMRPGAAVWIEVMRAGERRSVRVVLEEPPSDPARVRLTWRSAMPAAGGPRESRVVIVRSPEPPEGDQAGFALTILDTQDEGVAVEPSAVRLRDGRLEVRLVRDRRSPEPPEVLRSLLGALERESETAYRDVSSTLRRVELVRSRVPFMEFRRGMTRLAEAALAEPGLAVRLNRAFAGAEFESVRNFSGRAGLDGLLVLRVVPGTVTARLGLRAGDLLVRAGDQPIREIEHLIAAIDSAAGEGPTVEWIGEGRQTRRAVWPRR